MDKEFLQHEGEEYRCLKHNMVLTKRMKINICDHKNGCEECDEKTQGRE